MSRLDQVQQLLLAIVTDIDLTIGELGPGKPDGFALFSAGVRLEQALVLVGDARQIIRGDYVVPEPTGYSAVCPNPGNYGCACPACTKIGDIE